MTRQERISSCAIAYADLDWPVIPLWSVDKDRKCLCGKKDCNKPGKHPHGKYAPNGYKSATTDGSIIAGWFNNNGGDINIGICAGKESGLVVLDVDPAHQGTKSLVGFEAEHGEIDTLEVITDSEDSLKTREQRFREARWNRMFVERKMIISKAFLSLRAPESVPEQPESKNLGQGVSE